MGDSLDQEVAMSRRDKDIATEASWQAHYILWSRIVGIQYPCGNKPRYEIIVGIYIRFLQYGVNYTNKDGLRAATLVGYAKAVSTLFTLQGFPSPVGPSGPNNAGGIIIMNHKREEDIAVQQYLFNSAILAKLGTMASSSCLMDSEQNLIFTMTCLGRFIGPLVSEYAQTSSKKVYDHIYPSGNKVIKAFTANNFVFFDQAGNTLELHDDSCLDQAHK